MVMKTILLLTVVMLLSACGQRVEGTYANGMLSYTFWGTGKVNMSDFLGVVNVDYNYKIEGKNIKVTTPEATQVFVLLEDGSLQTPSGLILKKRPW